MCIWWFWWFCCCNFCLQVSVVDELGIPVKFVGVGEGVEDLQPFDAEAFVSAVFSWGSKNAVGSLIFVFKLVSA